MEWLTWAATFVSLLSAIFISGRLSCEGRLFMILPTLSILSVRVQIQFRRQIFIGLDILCLFAGAVCGSHERRLLNDLMNSYQKLGMEAKY